MKKECKDCPLEKEDCCNYEKCYTSDPCPETLGSSGDDPREDWRVM